MSPTSDVSGPLRLLCLSLYDLHVTCVNVSGGPTIIERVGVVILFLDQATVPPQFCAQSQILGLVSLGVSHDDLFDRFVNEGIR